MLVRAEGRTDTGVVREHNEDALLTATELGLFAVADGMGGHLAGEIASRMAVDVLHDYLQRSAESGQGLIGNIDKNHSPAANRLASGIRLANRVIHEAGQSNGAWRRMGTTIVAALVDGSRLALAHVGDSRGYLIRGRSIIQLTDDHSLVAEQQRQGLIPQEAAATSRLKNIITRALGEAPEVEVDLSELDIMDGDRILLCSDGLTNMVSDEAILGVIAGENDPGKACRMLIDKANENGGRDNITLVLIYLSASDFCGGIRKIFRLGR